MYELPLFPLNTVLFPGMPMALHIFEDRYKLMIGRCIQERRPFGVVLIKKGLEATGPLARPHFIGCTAHITQVERLTEGRMNIGAIGRERFRIVSLADKLPYLVGQVESYPLGNSDPLAAGEAARRLRSWVIRYMDVLSQIESLEVDPDVLPRDPVTLAYLAANLLQVPAEEKQGLLAVNQAAKLLATMRPLYRREVAFLQAMVAQRDIVDQGMFSLN